MSLSLNIKSGDKGSRPHRCRLYGGVMLVVGQCLFCAQGDGGFTSREHTFPEAVANDVEEAVLPPGIVCDRCNNGPLAKLDQTLCDFLPIQMRRTHLGIPSKSGKVPTVRLVTGRVEPMDPSEVAPGDSRGIRILSTGQGMPLVGGPETDETGQVRLRFHGAGGRPLVHKHMSELARAVLKIAFETAFTDHGHLLHENQFDDLRETILSGRNHHGLLALGQSVDPADLTLRVQYDIDHETGSIPSCGISVLGVFLGTTSAPRSTVSSEAMTLLEF